MVCLQIREIFSKMGEESSKVGNVKKRKLNKAISITNWWSQLNSMAQWPIRIKMQISDSNPPSGREVEFTNCWCFLRPSPKCGKVLDTLNLSFNYLCNCICNIYISNLLQFSSQGANEAEAVKLGPGQFDHRAGDLLDVCSDRSSFFLCHDAHCATGGPQHTTIF